MLVVDGERVVLWRVFGFCNEENRRCTKQLTAGASFFYVYSRGVVKLRVVNSHAAIMKQRG